jgi:magnesium transporter
MELLHIDASGLSPLSAAAALPEEGMLWIDCVRDVDQDWPQLLQRLKGVSVDERHLHDSLNEGHPSFYDFTRDYDMIIFRGAAQGGFSSRPVVFFLGDGWMVTVQSGQSRSIAMTRQRLAKRSQRQVIEPAVLLHMILNAMVDNLLAMREPFLEEMQQLTDGLLDSGEGCDDWHGLLQVRRQLRQLDILAEEQESALLAWRDLNAEGLAEPLRVRFTDLLEHIHRMSRFAEQQQHELDSLLQLHFSSVAHRTNAIVRTLTLLSAIFMPLSLIAAVYGMNFENMPELHSRYGYFITLGAMAGLIVVLVSLFRLKRWW